MLSHEDAYPIKRRSANSGRGRTERARWRWGSTGRRCRGRRRPTLARSPARPPKGSRRSTQLLERLRGSPSQGTYSGAVASELEPNAWSMAELPDGGNHFDACLVSFIATNTADAQVLLGSGFTLLARGGFALCVTARHVLDFAEHQQAPQSSDRREFEALFGSSKDRLQIRPESLRVMGKNRSGAPMSFVVRDAVRSNTSDVACVWISRQDDGGAHDFGNFTYRTNAEVPDAGAEVMVAALNHGLENKVVNGPVRSFNFSRGVRLLRGRVRDLDRDGRYLQIGPNFTTSIPLRPGVSGAPVFDLPSAGATMVLRGIVSSDNSPEDAFDDMKIAGAGRCASICSMLSLPITSRSPHTIGYALDGNPVQVDLPVGP